MTDIKQQIADLWPDKCPECGNPAWIGAFQVTCVMKGCRNGSEKEFEKYAKLITKQLDEVIEKIPGQLDIDDDEPTHPGLQAPTSFGWFKGFNTKLEVTMRPFGKCWAWRCADEDSFDVMLYNKPTDLYVSEKFSLKTVTLFGDPTEWLLKHVALNFPRCLEGAWRFKQVEPQFNEAITDHIATPPSHISTGSALQAWLDQEHTIKMSEGMTRHLSIGQTIDEWVVCKIDRCKDEFSIKSWV